MAPIRFTIPLKTSNTMNANFGNSREAAFAQARKDRVQRETSKLLTQAALTRAGVSAADVIPVVVTLTRHSSGRLDPHDGIGPALKRVVDGIALALGIDDGGPFVDWIYRQKPASPGVQGIVVVIQRRADVATGTA